jgi:hypothetical protein
MLAEFVEIYIYISFWISTNLSNIIDDNYFSF